MDERTEHGIWLSADVHTTKVEVTIVYPSLVSVVFEAAGLVLTDE